jgi:hypothetical protein
MRFYVEIRGKKYKVGIDVATNCWIEDEDGNQVAFNSVTLNHRDKFDLLIGAKLALRKTLEDITEDGTDRPRISRVDRIYFWDMFKRAFAIGRWKHKAMVVPRADAPGQVSLHGFCYSAMPTPLRIIDDFDKPLSPPHHETIEKSFRRKDEAKKL